MSTPKVLILCYDFPPLNTAGSHRINGWKKHFNSYGVHPIIVTRKWDRVIKNAMDYDYNESGEVEIEKTENHTLYRIPYKKTSFEKASFFFRKKKLFLFSKVLTFTSYFVKFLPHINIEKAFYFRSVYTIIKEQKPDLIIASGEPFILFKYAQIISKKTNVPYALDYRDGWSTDFGKTKGLLKFISNIEARFEAKYLKGALFVTTAAQLLKEELLDKFKNEKVFIVENGSNLELINSIHSPSSENFELVYTGTIYPEHNIKSFFEAFEEFVISTHTHAVVKFVGINYYENKFLDLFEFYANRYPKNILILPKVPQEKAISLQKEAAVLLKFCSRPVTKGFYGAKLYEYASLNKPILTVAGIKEHAKTDFFEKEGVQYLVYDKKTCLNTLNSLYHEFISGNLANKKFLSMEQIYSISRESQVSVLAGIIKAELHKYT